MWPAFVNALRTRRPQPRSCGVAVVAGSIAAVALGSVGCGQRHAVQTTQTQAMAEDALPSQGGTEIAGDGESPLLMHRTQTEAPLNEGWHLAVSTEGGFSVEIPIPFNDFRVTGQTTDGVEMRSHVVGAKTPGLLAWTAACMVRRDGKGGAGAGTDSTQVHGSPPIAVERKIVFDDMICMLIIEAQGTDPLPSEEDRQRFLMSFKRVGQPVW